MKKFYKLLAITLILFLSITNVSFAIEKKDLKDVVKITKKIKKLADKNKIDKLSEYYSENYVSFDGYNKKEIIEVFKTASKLYPDVKTKEKILKVEEKDGIVKVYINELSKTDMTVKGQDAIYSLEGKVKGKMETVADYSISYKKENDGWKIVGDEIFLEETKIFYGEALDVKFEMETPENIVEGEEFCVKTTVEMPKNRFVVGSIGHDKIVFPPEKYNDPYRSVDETGILERIMVANKDGKNEYANSTFAFIAPREIKDKNDNKMVKPAISGMGIYLRRMNIKENNL